MRSVTSLVCMWGGEVGVGGVGGVKRVIVVQVRESVFRNLTHSYTWYLKKTDPFIYLIVRNVDLFIYCPSIFILITSLDKYSSQCIKHQENKQPPKISERKIYAYTGVSEKWCLSHTNREKSG